MLDQRVNRAAKANQPHAAESSTACIQRRRFFAPARAAKPLFLFLLSDVLFDKGDTGRKDRGKRQEQSADSRTKTGGNRACNHGHRAAKRKTNGELMPMNLSQRAEFEMNHHNKPAPKPSPRAIANHTGTATNAAALACQRRHCSKRQTAPP